MAKIGERDPEPQATATGTILSFTVTHVRHLLHGIVKIVWGFYYLSRPLVKAQLNCRATKGEPKKTL